jgi:hypothetical protein
MSVAGLEDVEHERVCESKCTIKEMLRSGASNLSVRRECKKSRRIYKVLETVYKRFTTQPSSATFHVHFIWISAAVTFHRLIAQRTHCLMVTVVGWA